MKTVRMTNLYTMESKLIEAYEAVRMIGGGTSKYDDVIYKGLAAGKKYTIPMEYQIELKTELLK